LNSKEADENEDDCSCSTDALTVKASNVVSLLHRLLSHESHDDEPGTRGCDDDVTSTEVATNGDVYERSYLEVLMQ
jgi:hypothetical protein